MTLTLLYIVYFIIVVGACIKIILDTKSSSKAISYLILVITFPVVGIIFYFSVGVNNRKKKMYQKKLKRDQDTFPTLEKNIVEFSKNTLLTNENELSYFAPLAKFCGKESLSSNNNKAELLINGEQKFPEFIKTIKSAKHHIHIEYYIYENDEIGTEIANLLIEKAKEGVEVRFIYDDFGSKAIRKKFIKKMVDAGVQAFPFYEINFVHFANRINYRNHRKILVVDGIIGYIGGINVSDKYYNNGKKELYWRDTHLKISGISVLNLQHVFLTDWNFCAEQNINFSNEYFPIHKKDNFYGKQLIQVIASGPDSEHPSIMYKLIQAILLSKKELLITTPYFIPEKSFLDALKIAKLSGVHIKIIVPYKSDSAFVNAACNSYYQDLLDVGIEIYQYKKGFIHAKTMICDEYISIIGTANLDNRSFDLNFEINAIVYDTKLAKEMKFNFENDLNDSKKILLAEWKSRHLVTRTIEKVAHLFSPLL